MSRMETRRPNASGQMITAGCAPVAGYTNAASQVPSGVWMVTSVSVTGTPAPDAVVVAAATVATDSATKSRLEISLGGWFSSCRSFAILFLLQAVRRLFRPGLLYVASGL